MAQNSVKPLLLSSMLSSAVTGMYAPLNGIGFAHPPFFFTITNASNQPILISYNGIDDHDFLAANTSFDFPTQSNSQPNAQVALFPKNTIVYIKGVAGTGSIYLSGYYV